MGSVINMSEYKKKEMREKISEDVKAIKETVEVVQGDAFAEKCREDNKKYEEKLKKQNDDKSLENK